jgi:hypothetical protein
MAASASRPLRRWPASPVIVLLLAVGLALTVVQAGQPLHLHRGSTAGLYNEEHVLAALDSAAGDAPLPSNAPGAGPGLAPTKVLRPAAARPAAPVATLADPRAPPLA